MKSLSFQLEESLLICYTIPKERVRPLLAHRLEVDCLATPEGDRAVVAALCCTVRAAGRLSSTPVQLTSYLAGCAKGGARGAALLRGAVGPRWTTLPLRFAVPGLVSAAADRSGPPARTGSVEFGTTAAPHADALDPVPGLQEYLLQRMRLYFYVRGHYLWKLSFQDLQAELVPTNFPDLSLGGWRELGLLSPGEIARPAGCFRCGGPVKLTTELPRPDALPWESLMRDEP